MIVFLRPLRLCGWLDLLVFQRLFDTRLSITVCVVWWVRSQQNVTVSGNRSCRRELRGCHRKGRSTSLLQNEKRHFFLSAKMLHNTWLSFCHTITHARLFRLGVFCSWLHPSSTLPPTHRSSVTMTEASGGFYSMLWHTFLQGESSCLSINCFWWMSHSSEEENDFCAPLTSSLWINGEDDGAFCIFGVSLCKAEKL